MNKNTLKVWLIFIGVALAFMLLAAIISFRQIHSDNDRVSGRVVSLDNDSLVIVDARGRETTLVVGEETSFKGDKNEMTPGALIYSYGKKTEDGKFISYGVRIMKKP